MSAAAPAGLNRELLGRLRGETGRFLASARGRRGLLLVVLLSLALLAINGLNVLASYVGRDFISAIEHRNRAGFVQQAWLYVGVFAVLTLIASVYRYLEESLGLLWREWQTRRLLDAYFAGLVYYRIEAAAELRNPDQRISEDVRSFTTTTLSFFLLTLNAAITVFSFSGVLWSISPALLGGAVLYALGGSALTVLLGRRLVGLNVHQLDAEANLRSELMHVRQNADALALARREEHLHRRVLRRLDQLVLNTRSMIAVDLRLGLFTNGYNYLIQIIPALFVAPLFMGGAVEFGVVTQSAMAFAWLAGAFSLAVTQFQSISTYTAVIARLSRLIDAMEHAVPRNTGLELIEGGGRLAFEHLSLRRPEGGLLLKDLELTVEPGCRTLVRSGSGHAKLALFRAVAGLDAPASGRIRRPDEHGLVLIPERPYLPRSSLRELLASSDTDGLPDDPALLRVLQMLHLEEVLREAGGLDAEHDWSGMAGPSEQVRLLVARCLLLRPLYVFLDRMNTALDAAQLERVLTLLAGHEITCLMLARPEHPADHFDAVLEIAADGGWTLRRTAAG